MSQWDRPWPIPESFTEGEFVKGPDGCDYDNPEDYLGSLLGFCGCGIPEACLQWLRDTLQEINERSTDWRSKPFDPFKERPPFAIEKRMDALPEPVAYILWYWMDHHKLIEHGGGVAGSWLTQRGEHLLERLQRFYPSASE